MFDGPLLVALTVASLHSVQPATGHYCQVNPGVLVEKGSLIAGAYQSSLCKPLEFAGYRFGDRLGFSIGIDHGYRTPVFGALDYRFDRVQVYATPEVINNRVKGAILGFAVRVW